MLPNSHSFKCFKGKTFKMPCILWTIFCIFISLVQSKTQKERVKILPHLRERRMWQIGLTIPFKEEICHDFSIESINDVENMSKSKNKTDFIAAVENSNVLFGITFLMLL